MALKLPPERLWFKSSDESQTSLFFFFFAVFVSTEHQRTTAWRAALFTILLLYLKLRGIEGQTNLSLFAAPLLWRSLLANISTPILWIYNAFPEVRSATFPVWRHLNIKSMRKTILMWKGDAEQVNQPGGETCSVWAPFMGMNGHHLGTHYAVLYQP